MALLENAVLIGSVDVPRFRRCQVFRTETHRATLHYHEPGGRCVKESYYHVAEAILNGRQRGFTHVYIGERQKTNLKPINEAMIQAAFDGYGIFTTSGSD